MYTLEIDTAQPYKVHIGTHLLEQVGELTRSTCGGNRAVIVTDTNVGPLYAVPRPCEPGRCRLHGRRVHL